MKKFFAVLMSLTLIMMMGTIAFAAETGTITISNAAEDATYSIYKMFDFTPVEGSTTQGRYTVVADWEDFLENEGKDYLTINTESATIEWVGEETNERKAELAKAAVAYAKDNSIDATATKTAEAGGEVTFEGVQLGYYAIDTSLGTVCALTNVNSTFTTLEKNEKPEIDKFVQEDSKVTDENDAWGKVNDADMGQTVNFKATVTVAKGAENYVMHDTMSEGLTFDGTVTVKVKGEEVSADNYTLTATGLENYTFEVAFKNDYIATLDETTVIEVYYSATLNSGAVVAGEGNPNSVILTYGENSEFSTTEKSTETYTWKMDVLKYTMNDSTKTPLAGAKFQLLDKDGNAIKLTAVEDADVPTYRVDETSSTSEIITDADGKFEIIGLDEGTYSLHEVEAPAGYNKIANDLEVVITAEYTETGNLSASYEINGNTPATIEVENKTGSLLPETGGIGTTIFYIVGGVLMLAAVVILIARKRMNSLA